MRHRKKLNHLSRKSAHRKAMLANMAISLIEHKRITTTVAKAKALRIYVEPLITKAKDDTTHSRRQVFSYLQNKNAVSELFREIAVKVGERPGGYTRILKTGTRFGDNAEMCFIELVDYNENMVSAGSTASKEKTTTRRSRRGGKKKTDSTDAVVAEPTAEVVEQVADTVTEDVVEEVAEVAEDVVEEVAEVAEDAVEEVAEVVEEKVEEVAEVVEEKVEEVAEVVEEKVEEVAEVVEEKVEEVKEEVKEEETKDKKEEDSPKDKPKDK